jgi:hypothetical protein
MSTPAETAVESWINDFVIEHNLCPFAAKELRAGRVRITETQASDEEALSLALHEELDLLFVNAELETTLLVHPYVLEDFSAYNDFLDLADELIFSLGLEGTIQIASFHPDYCFAETQPESPENKTNRSPFPLLHLLREDSVAKAAASHPDVDAIPQRNIELMKSLFS